MQLTRPLVGRISSADVAAFPSPKRTAYAYFSSKDQVELGAGVCEIPVGSSNQMHTHDSHDEVIYVLAGRVKFVFPEESVVLEPFEAVYIPKGLAHQIFNAGEQVAWHTFTFTSSVPVDNIVKMYRKDD